MPLQSPNVSWLLTLEALLNDHKRLPQIPCDTKNRIRHLAYFWMIHVSNLVCQQRMRMNRQCVTILYHLLRNMGRIASTKIIEVEEMVAMFLYMLAHDVKNREIQREFVRSGEIVSHIST